MSLKQLNAFQDHVSRQFAWRRKELTAIKFSIESATGSNKDMLLRAGHALLYAHWEGFIKQLAEAYIEHVRLQGIPYKDLKRVFWLTGMVGQFKGNLTGKNIGPYKEFLDFFVDEAEAVMAVPAEYITTNSNLDYEVLCDIMTRIGVNVEGLDLRQNFINSELVSERNKIAHGEYRRVNEGDFFGVYSATIELIESFMEAVIDAAETKAYLLNDSGAVR